MFCFSDGFDLYGATADLIAGYWDGGGGAWGLLAGRFSGSRALQGNAVTGIIGFKNSGANDAVHHLNVAVMQPAALTGSSTYHWFRFGDGATSQCTITFRSDGTILLQSGATSGATLATYPNAITLQNQWFVFEFEVVIHNTAGSFTVRTNGATSNSFQATGLNTRGGTANNYANRLSIGNDTASIIIDDLLWRSDASSVPWVGDIRCYTRMPVSTASQQFSASPPNWTQSISSLLSTNGKAANAGWMTPFVAAFSGAITSATVQLNAGGTGNMKAAIYAADRSTVLAASNAVVNPIAGFNTVTFSTPPTVTKGTTYYFATDQDFTVTYMYGNPSTISFYFTTTYASFPAAAPALTSGQPSHVFTVTTAMTSPVNLEFISEAQQDGLTSYLYDSTVGHADFYNIASIGVTPPSTVAVTTRMFAQKSDAGSRSGAVQLKSGSTTVSSSSGTVLPTWSATDIASVTLSNGNLTATSSVATYSGVRGTTQTQSGKYYFESTTSGSVANTGVGIATPTASLTVGAFTGMAFANVANSLIFVDGSSVGSMAGSAFVAGDVLCVAVDMALSRIWFRKNGGNWNNSGTANPSTNVGGVSISALFPSNAALPVIAFTTTGTIETANFGATAFAFAVPSGFAAWPTAPGGVLSTTWSQMYRTDLTDPATGAAWTAAAVNAVQVGPTVTA